MKKIEKLIPIAINAIETTGIARHGAVDGEFNGYISSFGANITRSGLLPSVIFYENEDANANKERQLVPSALLWMIYHEQGKSNNWSKDALLSKYLEGSSKTNTQLMREVSDAAVALKIALRTFKILKS